ncbi:prepilin peptidase [Hominifimenecus sp. rT4P-3]|uniref:prepilin peptidase n=1 Tax=Hominifimenecus sp. rT4P-3 TaxID=3242979 RepID=UPI003DA25757
MNERCFCILLFSALAALWDCCLGRIPNPLLGVFWLLGFFFEPSFSYFFRGIPLILFLYPMIGLHMMGAGDGKLFGVLGCYLGYPDIFFVFFLSCLFGVVGATIRQGHKGFWKSRFSCFFQYIYEMMMRKEVLPYPGGKSPQARLPMGLPILGGVITVLFFVS